MDNLQPTQPQLQRRVINKLAQRALARLRADFDAEFQTILKDAAEIDGVSPEQGWQFDPQSTSWVREVPPEPPTE